MARLSASLRLALVLGAACAIAVLIWFRATGPAPDPSSARIVTDDVTRFWAAFDASTPETRAAVLQADYLDQATPGLKGFIPQRIESAEALARSIETHPAYYASARESTLRLASFEPAIRAAFERLEERYPDAVFPDVYFVIGRMNSGGTTGRNALIVGAEMYGRTDTMPEHELSDWHRSVLAPASHVPGIVAHELIHYQQPYAFGRLSLLAASVREGTADFVAELIAGQHINGHIHAWADPREAALWAEFQSRMHGDDYTGWLYDGDAADGRPADLGYWMGYRIAKAFYDRTADKAAALHHLLTQDDAVAFLAQSGYGTAGTE